MVHSSIIGDSDRRQNGVTTSSALGDSSRNSAAASAFRSLLGAPEEPNADKKTAEERSDDPLQTDPVDDSGNDDSIYGTVTVDGKVVATLYNNGSVCLHTGSPDGGLPMLLPLETSGGVQVGPELAAERGALIAQTMGGTTSVAGTAQSQSEWEAAHPEIMAQVAASQGQASDSASADQTAQSLFAVQRIGQQEETATDGSDAVSKFREFMKLASEGPGALLRAQFLSSKGLTEDDVANMSPEDRKKLEAEIKEFIENKIAEDTGIPNQKTGVSEQA